MEIEKYPSQVIFASEKLENDFENLKEGKFEDKELYRFIKRAIDDLKKDSACGARIPKRLWPKEYIKIGITNLWKYDLPNAWRLIYTMTGNEVRILATILEWFDHKNYERRFKYS